MLFSLNKMMEWYYVSESNSSEGPVSEKDLKDLLKASKIGNQTLVWNEEMENWIEIINIPALKKILIASSRHKHIPAGPPVPLKRFVSTISLIVAIGVS